MSSERLQAGTQENAAYTIAQYMDLERWVSVANEDATGVVLTEYDAAGRQLCETVAQFPERAPAHPLHD